MKLAFCDMFQGPLEHIKKLNLSKNMHLGKFASYIYREGLLGTILAITKKGFSEEVKFS